MGSNRMYSHQYSVSDFGVELSQAPQWTPPAIQEFRVHHNSNSASLSLPFATPLKESGNPERLGSTSSRSGSSESELGSRLHFHTQPSNSSRCLFVSKPVYPLSLPIRSPARVASDIDQRSSSTSSSVDFSFSQASESLESEPRRLHNLSIDHRCRLCDRFLSQRSPWGSHRIVRSGDLPVAGILSCHHVFHAECLDQATSKSHKSDPPCPVCFKMEDGNSPEPRSHSRLRGSFPRLRTYSEGGPSRPWGCGQVKDCVEGALHTPPRNSMVMINRNQLKKNYFATSGKELPGKAKRSGPCAPSPFWAGSSTDHDGILKAAVCSSPDSCEKF